METENVEVPYGLRFDVAETLGRSCGSHRIFKADTRKPQGTRKATAGGPQGDRRGALRRTCGQTDGNKWVLFIIIIIFFTRSFVSACRIATANVEMKKVITPHYNSTAPLRPVKYSHTT